MSAPRVCLICDHPARDLDGLTLLACELASRGVETFLVPMYDQREVFSLAPDLVLVNYVRFANAAFVQACVELGFRVGVLDTEGGVRQDMDDYARQVAPFARDVDLYCVWGEAQYEALDRAAGLRPGALRATGCPRYDWTVTPWRDAIADPAIVADPMILVNTNFPILRPRFQSREREIEQLLGMGYGRQLVMDFIDQSEMARSEVIATTRAVARALPSATVILRPHPFEERATYVEALASSPNVRVEQTGPVFEWIRRSRLVIHFNCSTAIDSMMLGVEAVHLDWIKAPLLTQPTAVSVSRRARGIDDVVELAMQSVAGSMPPVVDDVRTARRDVIKSFFFSDDGRSSVRVADAIAEVLARQPSRRPRGWGYATRILRSQRSLRSALVYGVIAMGGAPLFERMRQRTRTGAAADAKQVPIERVHDIVQRLQRVSPEYADVDVVLAGRADRATPHLSPMRSVRLARRAATRAASA